MTDFLFPGLTCDAINRVYLRNSLHRNHVNPHDHAAAAVFLA